MNRDLRIGLAIILVGAPLLWWAVGFAVSQLAAWGPR